MDISDYVRVLVPREGAADLSHTTSASRAEAMGWELLDEPTHDSSGRVRGDTRVDGRPLKPKTTVEQSAAEKTAVGATPTTQSDNQPSDKES